MKRNKETAIVLVVLFLVSMTGVVDGAINIISNPGFVSGTTSWLFYTNGIGTFSIISPGYTGNNAAKLDFSSDGTNIQLYQNGIILEANTRYRLNFAAYSNTGHDVTVNLIGIPYEPYGLKYTANLGTSWQTFTTEFTTKGFTGAVSNGRLQFWFVGFAASGDTYYIDDIQLEKASTQEPPIITTQPLSQAVTEGQTVSFSVLVTVTSPLSYQWQKNGVAISGATSSNYTTPAMILADNGANFSVNVSNAIGSVTSDNATLTVNNLVPIDPIITTQLLLHPDNNHYFLYKGKPTVLIGSNEHYGAALNLDFDYDIYLNELQSKGLNYVRIFSGTYIEPNPNMGSWWDIDDNTLAPTNNGFISPWARSTTKGFAGDSNSYKFDLSQWDTEYFDRLRDFVRKADSKGIIVEYVFFCPSWSMDNKKTPLPDMWARSPMNIVNNINNAGATTSWDNDGYDMIWDVRAGNHNGGLTPYMGNMVTKVVQELNEFDNVIFQPAIESYKGDGNGGNSDRGVTMETIFEEYIISKIIAADTPKKHLISQNRDAAWGTNKHIKNGVSVISWDAGDKSDIVAKFYNLNKPLSNDEFAYGGRGEVQYRRAGWKWIIDGGAIFNMLDLSFTPYRGEEAGTKILPYATSTGGTRLLGGSEAIRIQLGILKDFIHSFNFVRMAPDNSILTGGAPTGTRALVEIGKQYAIYIPRGTSANLRINLPAGNYKADWVNTKTGNIDKTEDIVGHNGGNKALLSPGYSEDIALRIFSLT